MTSADNAPPPKLSAPSLLAASRPPVARYRPMVIAAGLGGVTLLVGLGFAIAFGGGHRPTRTEGTPPPPAEAPSPSPSPEIDRKLPVSYAGVTSLGPGNAELPVPDAAAGAAPPAAAAALGPSPEVQRLRDEARAARGSGAFFPQAAGGGAPVSTPATPVQVGVQTPAAQPADLTPKARFLASAGGGPAYVATLPRAPLSPYEIKAGTVIPAALVTGLNSDLPGPVIAQVTAPVFDHLTGRTVLIPQGSRLIGTYDSQVTYGQDRALVAWTRIIFPDGRSIDLGAMVGADLTGAGGLADRVDSHAPVLARAIGLSTLISVGSAAAQNSLSRGSVNLVLQDGAGGLSAQASQVGQRLVDRDLQHAPTIRIRPGWPLRVLVDKDLVVPP